MATTRAVVLARGLGTRMRAPDAAAELDEAQRRAADAGIKMMMPVHGRPFLDYLLAALADAGLSDVGLVVAPDHQAIRRHYRDHAPSRIDLGYIVQTEPLGTADAILAAEPWTQGSPFLAMNADNLYPVPALRALASLEEPGLCGFDRDDLIRTSNIAPERVLAFALVEADRDGYLTGIVEKPSQRAALALEEDRPHPRISMNLWRFDGRIFAACRDVPRSSRGEFELPEAVALAARRGARFKVLPARGPVLDLSTRADAADVERRLEGEVPRP